MALEARSGAGVPHPSGLPSVVLAVEVMPPDFTNTERVLRMNPPDAVRVWLREAAETEGAPWLAAQVARLLANLPAR